HLVSHEPRTVQHFYQFFADELPTACTRSRGFRPSGSSAALASQKQTESALGPSDPNPKFDEELRAKAGSSSGPRCASRRARAWSYVRATASVAAGVGFASFLATTSAPPYASLCGTASRAPTRCASNGDAHRCSAYALRVER